MPGNGAIDMSALASSSAAGLPHDRHDQHGRLWWRAESRRLGSDWAGVVALHHDVVQSFRRAYEAAAISSIANSTNVIALKDFRHG